MMKLLPITGLDRGMSNDNPVPGTLREVLNLLPWRGSLRRRGPIKRHEIHDTDTSDLLFAGVPTEACHNANNRGSGKTLYAIQQAATYGELHAAPGTYAYGVIAPGTNPTSRMVAIGREIFAFPKIENANSTNVWVTRWNGADPSSSLPSFTGNVTLTAGSRHVTFANPIAVDVARAGYLITQSALPNERYAIEKSLSSTTLLLQEPARTTVTTSSWAVASSTILQANKAPASGGLFVDYNNGAGPYNGANNVSASTGTFHAGRLFVGNMLDGEWSGTAGSITHFPTRIRWSALAGESDASNYKGKQYFNANAFLDLGDDGGPILGLSSLNGALVVLRRSALQVITGSFATSGSDLGATVNTVIRAAGAGGWHAWEEFDGGIAFADEHGVYVWDGGEVTNLTRGAIERAYRMQTAGKAANILVTCPGNRIIVTVDNSPNSNTNAFVYDLGTKGWYRIMLDGTYGRMADTGDKYLTLRKEAHNLGGGDFVYRSYDMRGVFEDLDTDDADRVQDEDKQSYRLNTYLLTNPIPLVDGIQNGRVTEVVLNDGGYTKYPDSTDYTVRLLRGAIYSGDPYSGEADVASQQLTAPIEVPFITGSEVNPLVDQRSVRVRMDGADESTHAMIEIKFEVTDSAAEYSYALNAIGLMIDGEDRYQSA